MAPAGKQRPKMQGQAPYPPLLECAFSKDVDLTSVLPLYPFFLHSVFAGLVPPFSSFFTAILNHYEIQALHLQPNSILLLTVFAFYCEAFVGVRPSVALFHHFFSSRVHDDAHLSACISFIVAQGDNLLLKAGKKVENFRHHWVLMSLKDANPRLKVPKGLPEKTSAWSSMKLYDPRAMPILERFSRDISAKRMTRGMIVKEFLAQRLAPLQAHSRPLWDYQSDDDKLRLRSEDLPTEELNRVMATLLGGDPGDLPEALGLLYRLDDRADLIAVLLVFDERGLFQGEGSGPVEVSSNDTFGEEDSEKTVDDCPLSVPLLSWAILLCELEDDDATGEVSAVISSRLARISRGPALAQRHAVRMRARPPKARV
ncbi:hypothetical protein D1007_42326 [Hordeum vulgare]|nr:hypothetical protein D1007_42326 [Hordeum vulgare]